MRTHENTPVRAAALAVAALLLAGCGAAGAPTGAGDTPATTGASDTADTSMAGMDMRVHDHPSAAASMICSDEIREAVTRTFALATPPARTGTWARDTRTYACSYRVPGGTLALSVQDARRPAAGAAYFAALRSRTPGARPIRGIESLGFPAVSSPSGRVAFLKDGKTLLVDAGSLARTALPRGFTRTEVAYSVASAVIGCWKE